MIGGIISTIGTGLTEIGKIGTTIGGIIGSFGLDGYDIGLSSIYDTISQMKHDAEVDYRPVTNPLIEKFGLDSVFKKMRHIIIYIY